MTAGQLELGLKREFGHCPEPTELLYQGVPHVE